VLARRGKKKKPDSKKRGSPTSRTFLLEKKGEKHYERLWKVGRGQGVYQRRLFSEGKRDCTRNLLTSVRLDGKEKGPALRKDALYRGGEPSGTGLRSGIIT